MMKIAIFAPSIYSHGGEQRVVTVIANALAKDNDVTIYTRDKDYMNESPYGIDSCIEVQHYVAFGQNPLKRFLRLMLRKKKTAIFNFSPELVRFAFYSKAAIDKMYNTINGKFDVVIAVSGDMSILLGYIKQKRNLSMTTIGWEHNSYEAYFETKNMYLWNKKQYFIESVKYLDSCIVLNEDIATKYDKELGIKCDVIYNPRSFVSLEKSKLTNKQFIACGRFVEAKGFDLLVSSFVQFAKVNQDWKLLIVGDGPMRSKLEAKVDKLGLGDRITFTGYVDNVKELMLNSSIYLLSSRWEGFPMCVTEAFEVGLPIIAYDIPAVIPLIRNNEGIKVEAFDVNKFAEGMIKLASDFKMRKKMSVNAINTANSLAVECIVEKWKGLVEDINTRRKLNETKN